VADFIAQISLRFDEDNDHNDRRNDDNYKDNSNRQFWLKVVY